MAQEGEDGEGKPSGKGSSKASTTQKGKAAQPKAKVRCCGVFSGACSKLKGYPKSKGEVLQHFIWAVPSYQVLGLSLP